LELGVTEHTIPSRNLDIESIELELLLQGIQWQYGFDFNNYARAPLRRRLHQRMVSEGLSSLSGLQELVLHDPKAMDGLLLDLSISVTAMFRDPSFYRAFRQIVVPLLRTYPFIRIWNAGCSTGEEAYSIAILLEEEGLYDRTRIYVTDMNASVLERARSGLVPLDKMQAYTRNYIESGGSRAFSDYYRVERKSGQLSRRLADHMVFAQHNLVSDGSFNDFNVILCRNVLIYFNETLQDRVHDLLYESLVRFGVLGLGQRESLRFTSYGRRYTELDSFHKIYKRVN
jgi:chemotaxis protein methyltransferase CheR